MSKLEINNEIVLMRHVVRKARLHIIRRLVRQMKIFEGKKGDEKHREKCKRKADKLGEELSVIKKLKDDEICRYSIKNERTLKDILPDEKSDVELRVLAILASHKMISDRVAKFKEKFPNYEEHLGPGRRKLMKLRRKAGKMAGKMARKEARNAQNFEKEEENEEDGEEGIKEEDESNDDSIKTKENIVENLPPRKEGIELSSPVKKEEEKIGKNKREAEITSPVSEIKRIKTPSTSLPKVKKEERIKNSVKSMENNKLSGIMPTSKESTVKSFARFLEEKDEENSSADVKSADIDEEVMNNDENNKIELEKEVDSFFMTEDGGGEYLSVVVPKAKLTEEDNIDEDGEAWGNNRGNFSKSNNNRFFDKVDSRFDKTNRNNNGRERSGFIRDDRFKNRNEYRSFINNNNDNKKSNDGWTNARRDFSSSDKSLNENMHPSWAAKKKQQEILKLGFQGKKIVFDDV